MARKAHGFTIVELLIVIIVIAILATISIVAYNGIQNSASETALKSDLRNAATQLGLAYANDGVYPGSAATLSKSTGTTFEYDSDGTEYCLSATSSRSGVGDWHISNTFGLTAGVCDGHTAGLGSLEGSAFPTTGGFTDITHSYGTGDTMRANIASVPTGAWMVVVLSYWPNENATAPAGWTTLVARKTTNTMQTSIFAKIKQSGDADNQDFQAAGTNGINNTNGAFLWGRNGAAVSSWTLGEFGDRANNATPTTALTPTLTTTAANSLVLSIATERTNADEANYVSLTGATPWVWVPQPTGVLAKNQTITVGYNEQSVVGQSQAMTVTYPNSMNTNATAVQIAIPPAN